MLVPALGHASADLSAMSLEDALGVQIEGASRFLQPLTEAPADVTVISAEDIQRFGYRTLAEALQSAPDVYATDGRDYTLLGIRGFGRPGDYNSRILLLTDGVKRNDPVYDQAMVGNEAPIDLDWIKQIEFVPGAASALYGGNALFGIINAVLWSGADIEGTRVVTELGSDGLARLSVLSGHQLKDGADWITGLSVYQQRGADIYFPEFDVPGISDGIARELDGERYIKAFAKYISGDWKFNLSYSARRKNVPTAYYGTLFNMPGNYNSDNLAFADVSHAAAIDSDWSRYLRLSLGAYHFDGQYVYPGDVSRDTVSARWLSAEYRLAYTGLSGHRLLLGGEMQSAPRLDQRGIDIATATVYVDERHSDSKIGFFAQDEWQLANQWALNLGARVDKMHDYGSVASPRAALIYNPGAETTLKLIHGRAFRPANAYERFYNDDGFSQKGNSDLIPERIVSNELVAKFPLTETVHGGATYYHYRLDHLIEQIIDPVDGLAVFVNSPTFYARGLELEVETVTAAGFRLAGSLALQQLRQSFGMPVNSPRRLLKLLADGPLFESGWTMGLNLQGIGPRATLNGSVPGYLNGNLVLRTVLSGKAGDLSLGIYNLTDKYYRDPTGPELLQDSLPSHDRQLLLRWEVRI